MNPKAYPYSEPLVKGPEQKASGLSLVPTKDDAGKLFLLRASGGPVAVSCINKFSPSGTYVCLGGCTHLDCTLHGWFSVLDVELLEALPE